jgi:Rps23 Pro-64 3,4-dihydroxylase Tpa1-like proline 4-hydroxylase
MLNPHLDATALAAQFQLKRRLQVRNFLQPEIAERLHDCLRREVPWGLAYREAKGPVLAQAETLARLSDTERAELTRKIHGMATGEFQFAYNSYMMITAYKEKRDPHLALHGVVEFLNSPPFIEFVKRVTGVDDIVKANAQATRYVAGHFLKRHDDSVGDQGRNRRIAYVINLSKDWQADWGGLLEFMDDAGQVTDVYMPIFNSLTLFTVPTWHQVSYVAPFAQGERYAITGWAISY